MIKLLKKILPEKLKQDAKDNLGVPSLSLLLKHLKQIGFTPDKVIDVGAYEGNWANEFLLHFPRAVILMVEAQENKRRILARLSEQHSKLSYKIALLSSVAGKQVFFCEMETASHITNGEGSENIKALTTQTLDAVVEQASYDSANFLKLDVQGHEMEVLKGGLKTLSSAEFCLLELTVLNIGDDSPLLLTVLNYMDEQGFQLYDLGQLMRRPFDKALYQLDALFIKKNSPFIQDKRW